MSELDKKAIDMAFNLSKPGKKFEVFLDNGTTALFYVSYSKGYKRCHRVTSRGTVLVLEKKLHNTVVWP